MECGKIETLIFLIEGVCLLWEGRLYHLSSQRRCPMFACTKCRGKKGNTVCSQCHGTGKVVRSDALDVLEAPGLELQLVEASTTPHKAPAWHPALGKFPGLH